MRAGRAARSAAAAATLALCGCATQGPSLAPAGPGALPPRIELVDDPYKTALAYFPQVPRRRTAEQLKKDTEEAEKKWEKLHEDLDQAHKDGLLYGGGVVDGQNAKRVGRVAARTFLEAAKFRREFWTRWWERARAAQVGTSDYVITGAMRRIPVRVYNPHQYKVAMKRPSLSWKWGLDVKEGGVAADKPDEENEKLVTTREGGDVAWTTTVNSSRAPCCTTTRRSSRSSRRPRNRMSR